MMSGGEKGTFIDIIESKSDSCINTKYSTPETSTQVKHVPIVAKANEIFSEDIKQTAELDNDVYELKDKHERLAPLPTIQADCANDNVNTYLDNKWSSSPRIHLVPQQQGKIVLPTRYKHVLKDCNQNQLELGTENTGLAVQLRESQAYQTSSQYNSQGTRPQATSYLEIFDPEGTLKSHCYRAMDESNTSLDVSSLEGRKLCILKDKMCDGTLKVIAHQVSDTQPQIETDDNVTVNASMVIDIEDTSSLQIKSKYVRNRSSYKNAREPVGMRAEHNVYRSSVEGSDMYESRLLLDLEGLINLDKPGSSLDLSQDKNNNERDENEINDEIACNTNAYIMASKQQQIHKIHSVLPHIVRNGRWPERLDDLGIAIKWIRQEVIQIKQEDIFITRRLLDIRARIHQFMGMQQHLSLSSNLAMLGSHGSNLDITACSSFISLDERALLSTDEPTSKVIFSMLVSAFSRTLKSHNCSLQKTLGRGLRGFGAGLGDINRSASTREPVKPSPRIKRKNSLPMANELEEDHFFDGEDSS